MTEGESDLLGADKACHLLQDGQHKTPRHIDLTDAEWNLFAASNSWRLRISLGALTVYARRHIQIERLVWALQFQECIWWEMPSATSTAKERRGTRDEIAVEM
jgi:hypothetical protein